MSKIYIFGANGFVGQSISRCLEKNNYDIVKIGRKDFAKIIEAPAWFQREVNREDKLVFASAIVPSRSISLLIQNLSLLHQFLEICSRMEFAYLLNISSDAVYGDYLRPITENDPAMPSSTHGLMHYSREFILQQSFAHKLGNLRSTSIYGPRDPHNSYGPNLFMRQATLGKPIQVFGRGEEVRDHIFIDDVAEIAHQMLSHSVLGNLNAASGKLWSFNQIAKLIKRQIPDSKIVYTPRGIGPLPHNGYREFNIHKLKSLFPNLYLTPMEEGLKGFLKKEV